MAEAAQGILIAVAQLVSALADGNDRAVEEP